MRESKTANHFVKYMVSNLSVNQSQLQEQVKQINRALVNLAGDLQGIHQKQFADSSSNTAILTKSRTSKSLPEAKSNQNVSNVQMLQLPTLLQRLDDDLEVATPSPKIESEDTRPSMRAILQLLQAV